MWLDDLLPFRRDAPPGAGAAADAFRPFGIAGEAAAGTLPFGRLLIFPRAGAPRRTVLVVAPMAGGHPFLMRDLAVALLAVADRVAVTDWPHARHVPLAAGRFGFAENCLETAQMIRALGADGSPVHVVGVCQGALPAFAAACVLAAEGMAPASLSLLGGPMDPARNPTRLWRLLQGRSLEALETQVIETVPPGFAGVGRRVFPAWRQIDTFALYLWRQTLAGGELPLRLAFDEGDDPLHFPLARLCWTMMDVSGELFMETVTTVFQQNALARGTLTLAGHPVEGAALERTALLTVEGEHDDIAAPGQTEAAHDLAPRRPDRLRRRLTVPGAGHFSLFYGRRMRALVIPAIAAVMAAGED